jgi:hypothetical protein
MIETKIYLRDKGYLDTFNDIQVPLNFSLADVSDISTRNSSFSKTIVLPGSKNNHRLLGELFEINLNFIDADFQINRKIEAVIYQNDVPVISGYFKLLKVNKLSPSDISHDENIEYEAVVFSNQAGIFDVIKDNFIQDVDLSQYNHILSFSAITATSLNTYIDGYKYIHHYTSADFYNVSDFRPSFYVKTLWDSIFLNAGYTYTSDFLNSEPFTKLLIPTNVKDLLISDEEVLRRSCRVSFSSGYSVNFVNNFTDISYLSPAIYFVPNTFPNGVQQVSIFRANEAINVTSTNTGQVQLNTLDFTLLQFNDDSTGVNFDGSYDNYNTTTFIYTAAKTGDYEVELNFGGTFSVSVDDRVYIISTGDSETRDYVNDVGVPKFAIVANFVKRNPNLPIFQQFQLINTASFSYVIPPSGIEVLDKPYGYFASGTTTANYTFRPDRFITRLNIGEQLFVSFNVITYATVVTALNLSPRELTYNFTINDYNVNNSYLKVTGVKNNLSSGDEVVLNDLVPKKIRQVDFIKSIVNMFNLYLIPDETNDKNIIVKTRDEFYEDFQTEYVDWTDKFDYSQEYTLTLLSELQNKTLNYTYKQSSDEVNKRYREQVGLDYGQYLLNFDNDFLTGEQKIELIFEPTPLVKTLLPLGFEGDSFIVPYLLYGKETAPKILYDGGQIQVADYTIKDVDISGITTNYVLNYYNYAGHFDNPITPSFDLNWNINELYFYNEVLPNVTTDNLYNLYWYDYVNLIAQSKLLTGYFNLDEYDIASLNFAKLIWIRDSYYILNKIIDYDATSNGLTKVELIKAIKSPKFNRGGRQQVQGYLSEVQTSNPIRFSKNDIFAANIIEGMTGNNNYGAMTSMLGRENNILTYAQNSNINGDDNIIGTASKNVEVKGSGNFIGGNTDNIYVLGNDNKIYGGNQNISLINCNNVVILHNIHNVNLTNVENIIVNVGSITYTSPYFFVQQGMNINNATIVNGGLNEVFTIKVFQDYEEQLIDNGLDSVFDENWAKADLVEGNIEGIRINYQAYLNY